MRIKLKKKIKGSFDPKITTKVKVLSTGKRHHFFTNRMCYSVWGLSFEVPTGGHESATFAIFTGHREICLFLYPKKP